MPEINTATSRHQPAVGASKAETTRHYLRRGTLYLLAVAVPLLVVWIRMRLPVPLEEHRMLVLFVPAILLTALFGGLGPAVVATVSTAIASDLYLIPPLGQWRIVQPHDVLQWTVLILSGVMAGAIGEMQRRSQRRMVDGHRQLLAAHEALQQSEQRLRMAEQGARVGVWDYDIASGEIRMSPECEALYGVAPGALRDHEQWRARIHPDDWGLVDAQLAGALQGALIDAEFRVCWPDGSIHWLYARGSAAHDGAGRALKLTGIDQDITLRKQAEQESFRASERYRLFLRHASDGIHALDAEGYLIEVSDTFCAMLGYAREELLGMHVSCWDAQFTDGELRAYIQRALDNPRQWTFETRHRRRDGALFDAEVSTIAIDLGERKVLFASARDVTARNQAEANLRERTQMLAESQRIAQIGSWRWDLKGPIVWSDETYRIYGVDRENFVPTVESLLALTHPDDRQTLSQWITDCATGEPAPEFDLRATRPDGSVRHLSGRGELVRGADGRPIYMAGTVQDITERVALEDALRSSEQEFRLLAEAMPQIVWVTRADGWNTYFNQQWVDYTGLTLEQGYGHGWNVPFHPDDQQRAWDAWRNAVEHNATYALECRLRRFDGSYRWWLIRGVPVVDDAGTILKWFGTCTDIEEIKQREEVIKASESRRQFALEAWGAGEWELDLRSGLATRSLQHDRIFGYDHLLPEWTYEMFLQHVLPEDRERVDQLNRQFLEGESKADCEFRIRRADGETRWLHAYLKHRSYPTGETTVVGIVRDITAEKWAANELDRMRLLMAEGERIAHLGTWDYDVATQETRWSEEEYRIYGIDPAGGSPVYQDMLRDRIHPDDADRLDRLFRQALEDRAAFEMEHRIVRPDGVVREIRDLARPVFDSEGALAKYIGVSIDITDAKEAERAKAKSERSYRSLFDNMLNGFAHCQMIYENGEPSDFVYLSVNAAFETLTGLKDVVGKKVNEVIPGIREQDAAFFEVYGRVARTGVPERQELFLRAFRMWFSLSVYSPERGYFVAVFDVITERKLQEQLLRDREARLRALLEGAQDGVLLAELPSNRFVEANPAMCRMLGYERAELLGLTPADIHPKLDLLRVIEIFERMARSEIILGEDLPFLRKDGTVFPCDVSATLLEIDGVHYLAGFFRDITARKQTERELDAHRHHLEELVVQRTEDLRRATAEAESANRELSLAKNELERTLQSIGEGLIVLDAEWRYTYVNARAEQLLDMPREEMVGQCIWDLFPDLPGTKVESNYRRAAAGERVEFETFYAPWNRWFRLSCFPREGGGISIFFADVTELKRVAVELEQSRERAESANRAKSEFLANMSHEIRTPLNAILGFSHLLQESLVAGEALQQVRKIGAAGRSLLVLINDILDFSKIEAGQLQLDPTAFRLNDVLDNLASLLSGYPDKPGLELVLLPPAGVPGLIGDAPRLQQVLLNLLSNAYKFTASGVVVLDVTCLDLTDRTATLRFSVRDTGIGIPEERQREIFAPFTQADATTTRRFGGTGLGLAIANRLVTLMGGELALTSTPGRGSEFFFTLTFECDALADGGPTDLAGLHALVVDSHPRGLEALRRCGAALGWEMAAAATSDEAQAVIDRRRREDAPLDVVVLDGRMLDEPGLALLAANATTGPTARRPAMILMGTSACLMDWRNQTQAAGIDGWLTKPVTPITLGEAVRHARQPAGSGEVAAGGGLALNAQQTLAGVRVLVVDDSDINRDLAESLLVNAGATVVTAEDGLSALDCLQNQADRLDVVLMDVQMPGLDGHEVTRRYRKQEGGRRLPIIALSAGAYSEQREAALAAGMDDYLAKPFEVDHLLKIVSQHAHRPAEPAPSEAEPPGLAVAEALKVWNDPAIYLRYLQKFVDTYGGSPETMAALLEEREWANASAAAHKLAGAAGSLGLNDVWRCARQLENAALASDAVTASEELKALRDALAVALMSIAAYGAAHPEAATGQEPGQS